MTRWTSPRRAYAEPEGDQATGLVDELRTPTSSTWAGPRRCPGNVLLMTWSLQSHAPP